MSTRRRSRGASGRRAVAAVLVAALALAGCSDGGSDSSDGAAIVDSLRADGEEANSTGEGGADAGQVDQSLTGQYERNVADAGEPEMDDLTRRVIRTIQISDICRFRTIRPGEPPAYDAEKLVLYAKNYYGQLLTIDLDRKITDRVAPPGSAKIPPPPDVVEAFHDVRRSLYVFRVRVETAADAHRQNRIDDEGLRELIDVAFTGLLTGPYLAADRKLVAWLSEHCPGA